MEMTQGISYTEVCARQATLEAAQKKDLLWLCSLNTQENAMEWGGFNNRLACEDKARKSPASTYMFGPLIDAKASHPDSVLTSLE
jgi:hypothetical protein